MSTSQIVSKPKLKPKLLKSRGEYTVGIVCALHHEAVAVQSTFDYLVRPDEQVETHHDGNAYTFGTIGRYHVVLAHLGQMGKTEATYAASNMQRSFPNIKLCLLVGICSIVPEIEVKRRKEELLLGDVVVSTIVKQFDFGKQSPTGFSATDTSSRGSPDLRRVLASLRTPARMRFLREDLQSHLMELDEHEDMEEYHYPGFSHDQLFRPTYPHGHHGITCLRCDAEISCEDAVFSSCEELACSQDELVTDRPRIKALEEKCGSLKDVPRTADNTIRLRDLPSQSRAAIVPRVFLGAVASGNSVIKNGVLRDEVAKDQEVIAFDLEHAGIWDVFPSAVVKAGCDYADSHKNKIWQNYAAMTAAACAKALLDNLQIGIARNVAFDAEEKSHPVPTSTKRHGAVNNFSGSFVSGRNLNIGNTFNSSGSIYFS